MSEKLTDDQLEVWAAVNVGNVVGEMARELLERRRAPAAPATPARDDLQADNERLRDALKKADGALGDIADGEPEFSDAGELVWCRNRAANARRITRAALRDAGGTDGN